MKGEVLEMGLFNRKDAEQHALGARAAAIQHAADLQARRMAATGGPRNVNVGGDGAAASTAPAGASGGDMASRLEPLGKLRDRGAVTPEEFEQQKQRILAAG